MNNREKINQVYYFFLGIGVRVSAETRRDGTGMTCRVGNTVRAEHRHGTNMAHKVLTRFVNWKGFRDIPPGLRYICQQEIIRLFVKGLSAED